MHCLKAEGPEVDQRNYSRLFDEFKFSRALVWIDQKQQRIEAAVWKSPIFKQWFKEHMT